MSGFFQCDLLVLFERYKTSLTSAFFGYWSHDLTEL